jgi:Kef-type K+ transport system membrane component KefB
LGLDLNFIHRVYRTSMLLAALGAVFLWEAFRLPAVLGWLIGSTLSLLMLAGVEWSVVRLIRPGSRSARGLLGILLLKLFAAALVLGVSVYGYTRGWINLLWLAGGFALPHAVLVLKLAGQKVRELSAPDGTPQRR